MILSDKLFKELLSLESDIEKITKSKSVNDIQMENFLRNLEKRRYNILSEIKLYNNTVEYKTDKIKNNGARLRVLFLPVDFFFFLRYAEKKVSYENQGLRQNQSVAQCAHKRN